MKLSRFSKIYTIELSLSERLKQKVLTTFRFHSQSCIVTFIGPVGVGKSTHMMLIRDHLRSKAIRTSTTFIKSSHFLTDILSKSLKALGAYEKAAYSGDFRIYPRRDLVRKLFSLWRFLDTLSIAIKFFFTVYLPSSAGFTVLIEEGLNMTGHTYLVILPRFFKTEPKALPLIPNLLGWVGKNNHVNIVLDANASELVERRKRRSFRQNELSEYITMQKEWMQCLNPEDTVFVETTGESIERVHERIVTTLKKHGCIRN